MRASNLGMIGLGFQVAWLLVLGIPVACIAWTVTHEEVFREPRQYCQKQCVESRSLIRRKFFYLFTCEYCFSHYVAAVVLLVARFKLLYLDWRGYVFAFFALVWIANQYMSIYNRLRLDIKHEQVEIKADEQKVDKREIDGRENEDRKTEDRKTKARKTEARKSDGRRTREAQNMDDRKAA
jgi:hypothetical protein